MLSKTNEVAICFHINLIFKIHLCNPRILKYSKFKYKFIYTIFFVDFSGLYKRLSQNGDLVCLNKENDIVVVVYKIAGVVCDVTTVLVRAGLQLVQLNEDRGIITYCPHLLVRVGLQLIQLNQDRGIITYYPILTFFSPSRQFLG